MRALLGSGIGFDAVSTFGFTSIGVDEAGLAATVAPVDGFGFFFITTPFRGFLESFLAAPIGADFLTVEFEDVVGEITDVEAAAESRGEEAAGAAIGGDFTITLDAIALEDFS